MPRFEPFRALRYASSLDLGEVSAPPYDVLSESDVERLRSQSADNVTWIDVPLESDGPDPYAQAAATMNRWIDDAVLVLDDQPSFTLYRMEFTDALGRARHTVGVLGALEVVDEGAGGVLPHERTTPKAKTDRLDLTRATQANLSPVWGLSLTAGLTETLRSPGEPLGSLVDAEGVTHTVERVTDPDRVAAISAAVAASPVLIADGHHRYAIARIYRDEQRGGAADSPPRYPTTHSPTTHSPAAHSPAAAAELTFTYVGELLDDQLSIDAIHRLYHGVDAADLLRRLRAYFDVDDAGVIDVDTVAAEMNRRGALCLLRSDGTGAWLRPGRELADEVRALDGAYLEHALAGMDVDVTYQHGVELVAEAVRSGRAQAAVLIRPTSIAEIRRTADERLLMPPKSTFFTPKLRTGMAIRPL